MIHDLTKHNFGDNNNAVQQLLSGLQALAVNNKTDKIMLQAGSPGPDLVSGALRPTDGPAPGSPRHGTSVHPTVPITAYKRVIIEICCGEDSRLGQPTNYSGGCLIIRVTISDDISTDKGVRKVRQALIDHNSLPILVWVSIPCTGGHNGLTTIGIMAGKRHGLSFRHM